jgi:hypothetical protein
MFLTDEVGGIIARKFGADGFYIEKRNENYWRFIHRCLEKER